MTISEQIKQEQDAAMETIRRIAEQYDFSEREQEDNDDNA